MSTESYRQQITAAQNAVTAAENAVKAAQGEADEAQAKVNELEQLKGALELQISITPENNADVTAETKARDEAKAAYAAAAAAEAAALEARNVNNTLIEDIQKEIDDAKAVDVNADVTELENKKAEAVSKQQGLLEDRKSTRLNSSH